MSSTSNTTSTSSTFQAIFEAALKDYANKTGKDLHDLDHPLASRLDSCDSPDSILDIFREQAREFDEFRKGDTNLFKWLKPIVTVLHTISTSEVLGDGVSSVNLIICHHPYRLHSTLDDSTRKGSLHRHPKTSIRAFLPPYLRHSLSHPELLDGQGREKKLRFPSRYFQVHRELPYTTQHLYRNSAHSGSRSDRDSHQDNSRTNHCPCSCDRTNESRATQYVFPS